MKILPLVAVLFFAPLLWAQTCVKTECAGEVPPFALRAPQAGELEEIAARFAAVNTIHSHFVQEKRMALLSEPVISEGVFSFQKSPARIRWEYTKPFQNGFLIDGEQTFRLEKGVKTAVKGVLARNIARQMMTWLSFDLQALSQAYDVAVFDGGVSLTPKGEKNSFLREINVWFSKENPQALSKIELKEPGGDSTSLTFTQTQLNAPMAEGTF